MVGRLSLKFLLIYSFLLPFVQLIFNMALVFSRKAVRRGKTARGRFAVIARRLRESEK
jgi:hypothetical protein